jgi:hypothetical protein
MIGKERAPERVGPRRIKLAEVAAEGEELRIGELLAAEAQHHVLEPRGTDLRAELRRDRLREIDAADFGAESWGEFFDLH